MIRASFPVLAFALALSLVLPVSASAETVSVTDDNLITNGSFEDTGSMNFSRRNWGLFTEIPGWTSPTKGEIQSNRTLRSIDAQDGDKYAELDSTQNATIYQDVTLAAAAYQLSFFYSPRVNNASQGTNDMLFSLGDVVQGEVRAAPNPEYAHGSWTEVVTDFIVEVAGTYRLSFTGAGAENERNGCGDCGALIDNVRLTGGIFNGGPDMAPVPLPAAAWLMIAGLGGLGAVRLTKRTKKSA